MQLGVAAFTRSALDGGRAMGLTSVEMLEVIAVMTPRHFHRSMTAHADARAWQDVYHCPVPAPGKIAYVRVTMWGDRVVVSFKEK